MFFYLDDEKAVGEVVFNLKKKEFEFESTKILRKKNSYVLFTVVLSNFLSYFISELSKICFDKIVNRQQETKKLI